MGRNAKKVVEGEEQEHVDGDAQSDEEQPTETMAEVPQQEEQAPPADPIPPRMYRVVGGPPIISHGGMPAPLAMGKVVSDHVADIDALRKQGVVLEEVK